MTEKKHIYKLCLAAMFVALNIITTYVISIYAPGTFFARLSFQMIPVALSGWLIGPFWACGSALVADLLATFLGLIRGDFNPLLTVSFALKGLIFGLILYKKKISIIRTYFAALITTVVCDLTFSTVALSLAWKSAILPILGTRLPWYALMFVVLPTVTAALMRMLEKPLYSINAK